MVKPTEEVEFQGTSKLRAIVAWRLALGGLPVFALFLAKFKLDEAAAPAATGSTTAEQSRLGKYALYVVSRAI